MASLHRRSSGLYLLSFRYDGRQFQRSLETSDAEEASHIRQSVERRFKLLRDAVCQSIQRVRGIPMTRRAACVAIFVAVFPLFAHAASYDVQLLLDSDNRQATGCTVSTS